MYTIVGSCYLSWQPPLAVSWSTQGRQRQPRQDAHVLSNAASSTIATYPSLYLVRITSTVRRQEESAKAQCMPKRQDDAVCGLAGNDGRRGARAPSGLHIHRYATQHHLGESLPCSKYGADVFCSSFCRKCSIAPDAMTPFTPPRLPAD